MDGRVHWEGVDVRVCMGMQWMVSEGKDNKMASECQHNRGFAYERARTLDQLDLLSAHALQVGHQALFPPSLARHRQLGAKALHLF